MEDVDDGPPVIVEDEVDNSSVVFGLHLNCKVLNWVFSVWRKEILSYVGYFYNFLQYFTKILLRKPGSNERHFKSIGKRVKSIKGLWINSSHNGKSPRTASDATELKNEYFYITILLSGSRPPLWGVLVEWWCAPPVFV